MQINSLGNFNFKGITPVITNSKQAIRKMEDGIEQKNNFLGDCMVEDMTPIYRTWSDNSELSDAVKEGKQVAFLITGEDFVKYCTGQSGYRTQASLTRHIDSEPVRIDE